MLELLKLPSMYEEAPFGLEDFDYDRLKVLHRPPRAVDVRERLPSAVRRFLDHPGRYIERSGADIERLTDEGKAPPKPYWCPRLCSSPGSPVSPSPGEDEGGARNAVSCSVKDTTTRAIA